MNFTEHELYIINKIAMENKWCNRLISRADLVKGRDSDERILKLYEDAIDNLVNKRILYIYLVDGRRCYCVKKTDNNMIISVLLEYAGKFKFINYKTVEQILKT